MKTIKSLFLVSLLCLTIQAFAQKGKNAAEPDAHMKFTFNTLEDVRNFDVYETLKGLDPYWDSDTIKILLIYKPSPEEVEKRKMTGDNNYVSLLVTEHYKNIAEEVSSAKDGIMGLINKMSK